MEIPHYRIVGCVSPVVADSAVGGESRLTGFMHLTMRLQSKSGRPLFVEGALSFNYYSDPTFDGSRVTFGPRGAPHIGRVVYKDAIHVARELGGGSHGFEQLLEAYTTGGIEGVWQCLERLWKELIEA